MHCSVVRYDASGPCVEERIRMTYLDLFFCCVKFYVGPKDTFGPFC